MLIYGILILATILGMVMLGSTLAFIIEGALPWDVSRRKFWAAQLAPQLLITLPLGAVALVFIQSAK